MSTNYWPMKKVFFILGMIGLYGIIAILLLSLVALGVLHRAPPAVKNPQGTDTIPYAPPHTILPHLHSAQAFVDEQLMNENGHINLYVTFGNNTNLTDNSTNSEAVSYYLLWAAQQGDKERFDKELRFMQEHMLQPRVGYMMWRLAPDDTVIGDGENIASDADLRAIKALLIAEEKWPSPTYTDLIDDLADGIEEVAITTDGYLAPYGGVSGESSVWTADEVWISYTDFTVLRELSVRRGEPWMKMYTQMKKATLGAQIQNGLYNSVLTDERVYGNTIDGGGYSINSLWIMLRGAQSGDTDLVRSANTSLQFYKNKYRTDAELYAAYSSNGDALNPSDTPWVYALVGHAAIVLDDEPFAREMYAKLLEKQHSDENSTLYGSFPEHQGENTIVGQFTMQESILALQAMYTGLPEKN